ncbi:MAG: GNAT family N-acetyltransferase [Actinomycetota bacterium]
MLLAVTEVVAVTRVSVEALLEGDRVFAERFGVAVAPGYLDAPEVLPAARDALVAGTAPGWSGFLILQRAPLTVVGFGGFKAPPEGGEVEIGYSVAPAFRRRGHASAAVACFVARARDAGIAVVSAHTEPAESPSTRLLERAGFTRTEVVAVEGLGAVWRWELLLDA